MAEKQKPHDLRDDIWAPQTTITNIDERLAGAKPSSGDVEKGNARMVTPEPGRAPAGQTTKS